MCANTVKMFLGRMVFIYLFVASVLVNIVLVSAYYAEYGTAQTCTEELLPRMDQAFLTCSQELAYSAGMLLEAIHEMDELEAQLSNCKKKHKTTSISIDQNMFPKVWMDLFEITAYSIAEGTGPPGYPEPDGFTSIGLKADWTQNIVAVDPKLIPYNSQLYIHGKGWYIAGDTGSAIKGKRLDILMADTDTALEWGRQRRKVLVIPKVRGG